MAGTDLNRSDSTIQVETSQVVSRLSTVKTAQLATVAAELAEACNANPFVLGLANDFIKNTLEVDGLALDDAEAASLHIPQPDVFRPGLSMDRSTRESKLGCK